MNCDLPDITVIGSINVDTVLGVDRLPAPGETLMAHSTAKYLGGKGANQAAAAAKLGASTRFVGACGDDEAGEWALRRLAESGVDVASTRRIPDAATGQALILVDAAGENEIVVNAGANAFVAPPTAPIPESQVVICQLEVPMEVCLAAARLAQGPFVLNPSPVQELPQELIDATDLFVVNEAEFAALPGLAGARLVAVTHGGAGADLRWSGRTVAEAPGVHVDGVSSTVGAGDAFCAALAIGLFADIEPEVALQVACEVGAESVRAAASQAGLRGFAEIFDSLEG